MINYGSKPNRRTTIQSDPPPKSLISACFLMLLAAFLGGCGKEEWHAPPFASTNELVIATVNGPTTFYEDSQGNYAGLEYDLANLFAQKIGMKAKFVLYANREQIEDAVIHHKVHFGAAGLTIPPDGSPDLVYGPTYFGVIPRLVYNSSGPKPSGFESLSGKRIACIADPAIREIVSSLKQKYPDVDFSEMKTESSDELLSSLSDGTTDYAIAYSNQIDIAAHFYPNIATAFDLAGPRRLSWEFPKDADPALIRKVQDFFDGIEKDGTLQRLVDRYYGHIYRLDQVDIVSFLGSMDKELPPMISYFQEAESLTGIDWRLLAALSYQESHWDPHATSPTGVRGIMMLTSDTADRLNVSDRLDARQSIVAGARYFAKLKDSIPPEVKEPDRTWYALAAYNLGTAHLLDAMNLAKRLHKNPDSWVDLKDTLPLLSRSGYFSTLSHGFARGGEAVVMVANIRNFYDILGKYRQPSPPMLGANLLR